MTKLDYLLAQLKNQLWFRPTVLSLIAVGWVTGAYGLQYLVSQEWPINIEKSTLTNLFAIMASTMLTVATFAVSVLVAAFSNISSSGTPRARVLVIADGTAQNALASFIGAFIYAVIALVVLSALDYGNIGRFVLFIGFVLSVGFVLMAFLRWVGLVSNLGALDDTIDRTEETAIGVFSSTSAIGGMGGKEFTNEQEIPEGIAVISPKIGYLRNVDIEALSEFAAERRIELWLKARPGKFVDSATELIVVPGNLPLSDEEYSTIQGAFTIGRTRNLDIDPRFALIILSEIADHSLSTANNDTGTSIRVIGVQLRIFAQWVETRKKLENEEIRFPQIHVPALSVEDLVNDAFMATSRSGAQYVEVSIRLQKGFRALVNLGHPELSKAARNHAQLAYGQAIEKISVEAHRESLREVALTQD